MDRLPKEQIELLHTLFPPMPDEVKLEFAGLSDYEVLFHSIYSAFYRDMNRQECKKVALATAYALEELGFHR